jgi:tetratricopeptide (TPR) repeat protein
VIELLLQADRTLTMGLVDQAERLYRQAAEADPLNAIAVVGLARVALERGDEREAWSLAVRALELDPEDGSAIRLEARMAEILAARGEPVERPDWVVANEAAWRGRGTADLTARAAAMPAPARPVAIYGGAPPGMGDDAGAHPVSTPPPPDAAASPVPTARRGLASEHGPAPEAAPKRGLLARLLGRR